MGLLNRYALLLYFATAARCQGIYLIAWLLNLSKGSTSGVTVWVNYEKAVNYMRNGKLGNGKGLIKLGYAHNLRDPESTLRLRRLLFRVTG
jgi:hypothetical protein